MKQYLIKFNDGTEDKVECADGYRNIEGDHWFIVNDPSYWRVYYGKYVETVTLLDE